MSALSALITETEGLPDQAAIFERFEAFLADYGFDCASYHIVKEELRRVPFDTGFVLKDFPERWVTHYVAQNYFQIDPIIGHAAVTRTPFGWYEIEDLLKLSPEQLAYLQDMRDHGLVDGLAVPIYGPTGNVAYFGLGSTRRQFNLSKADRMILQCACTHIHNQVMQLRAERTEKADAALSPREREVLTWIARGKSNTVIAEILEVSEHTIDTLVRRTFTKLNVSDRVSAALRGVALNLIEI